MHLSTNEKKLVSTMVGWLGAVPDGHTSTQQPQASTSNGCPDEQTSTNSTSDLQLSVLPNAMLGSLIERVLDSFFLFTAEEVQTRWRLPVSRNCPV
jgi:hypothetical protein